MQTKKFAKLASLTLLAVLAMPLVSQAYWNPQPPRPPQPPQPFRPYRPDLKLPHHEAWQAYEAQRYFNAVASRTWRPQPQPWWR